MDGRAINLYRLLQVKFNSALLFKNLFFSFLHFLKRCYQKKEQFHHARPIDHQFVPERIPYCLQIKHCSFLQNNPVISIGGRRRPGSWCYRNDLPRTNIQYSRLLFWIFFIMERSLEWEDVKLEKALTIAWTIFWKKWLEPFTGRGVFGIRKNFAGISAGRWMSKANWN